EVRLGILPAVVSPYVVRKIGFAHATTLFTTGIRFDSRRAYEVGLVEAVEEPAKLDGKIDFYLDAIVAGGPHAVNAAKRLVREVEADLVHPGYGFLAESPLFAKAVVAAGMRFVGPTAEVLASLGDKVRAKALAQRARVPVLPGYMDVDQRDEAFIAAATRIG